MLLRAVYSRVPYSHRKEFDRTQQRLCRDYRTPGYEVQIAGWNLAEKDEACILGVWEDERAFFHFMESSAMSSDSDSQQLMHSSQISMWSPTHNFTGVTESAPSFQDQVVRIVQITVMAGRQEHFRDTLDHVWEPGMTDAGIERGIFLEPAGAEEDNRNFLIVGQWEQWAHARFYLTNFGELLNKARPDLDVAALEGRVMELEPDWCF